MLNLGAHTALACDNDRFQAKLTLGLTLPAALLCCLIILAILAP